MTRSTAVPTRVLLTGASGLIGSATLETLRANGIAVTTPCPTSAPTHRRTASTWYGLRSTPPDEIVHVPE